MTNPIPTQVDILMRLMNYLRTTELEADEMLRFVNRIMKKSESGPLNLEDAMAKLQTLVAKKSTPIVSVPELRIRPMRIEND